jgi:hypothetical protein
LNCHHARQLISPYLDQQLTGRQMLALQEHFGQCLGCESEMRSIRQVKLLLRGLHESRPQRDISEAISTRLAASEGMAPEWNILNLPAMPIASVLPQRGRRLAAALVLSSVTVFLFAAPFAPASHDGAKTASSFVPSSFYVSSESLSDPVSLSVEPALPPGTVIDLAPPRMTLADDMDYAPVTPADSPSSVVSTPPRDTFPDLTNADPAEHVRFYTLPPLSISSAAQSSARVYYATQLSSVHR